MTGCDLLWLTTLLCHCWTVGTVVDQNDIWLWGCVRCLLGIACASVALPRCHAVTCCSLLSQCCHHCCHCAKIRGLLMWSHKGSLEKSKWLCRLSTILRLRKREGKEKEKEEKGNANIYRQTIYWNECNIRASIEGCDRMWWNDREVWWKWKSEVVKRREIRVMTLPPSKEWRLWH